MPSLPLRIVAASGLLAALALPTAVGQANAGAGAKSTTGSQAVVAVIDSGINPYHRVFRDRSAQAYRNPSTYLPGYPKNAIALKITLDAPDYYEAVRKDCDRVWSKLRPGQLYWFPGTKIVGAISFGAQPPINCDAAKPGDTVVLSTGHGTMTASRATSTEYGGCRECRVVAVQLPLSVTVGAQGTTDSVAGVRWAATNNNWIDAQSNSWGPLVPGWSPTSTGLATSDSALNRAIEESARKQLSFWASGNGAAFRFGALGHPTLLAPHLGPSPLIVGGFDSGYFATWPGSNPTLASDACNSWATDGPTTTASTDSTGGGTSGATPYAAGGAARILLEARRILGDARTGYRGDTLAQGKAGVVRTGPLADGRLTTAELKAVLLHTATARPVREHDDGSVCDTTAAPYNSTPLLWKDVPAGPQQFPLIGYGAVDTPAKALAFKVLRGTAPIPARPEDDSLYALDLQARTELYRLWSA